LIYTTILPINVQAAFNAAGVSVFVEDGRARSIVDIALANSVCQFQSFPEQFTVRHYRINPELMQVLAAVTQADDLFDFEMAPPMSEEEFEIIRQRIAEEPQEEKPEQLAADTMSFVEFLESIIDEE
jgi:hypothetical protein